MKTRIFQILGIAAIAAIGMSSCDTDACADVECGDYGTCLEGDCVCDAGFEGEDCATMSRAKFIGTYDVDETCGSSMYDFEITMASSGTSPANVLISNFWDSFNASVVASVDENAITIATQDPDNDGFTVSGSGTYLNGEITMSYTITDTTVSPADVTTCTASMVKQ